MPELPEVETTRRGLLQHVEGNTIIHVVVRQSQLRWPIAESFPDDMVNKKIDTITRRAKYLIFETVSGFLLIHLGMSGSLRIVDSSQQPNKHDHLDFIFINGTIMRYNDPRRFGSVLWNTGPIIEHWLLQNLGPEPLLAAFDGEYLYQASRNRKAPVKSFIMDSRIVVGVGNIYANEALFMAGILPARQAGKISLTRYQKLVDSIKATLQNAISQGGTTLRDFVNEKGKPGYFQQQLQVYGRSGKPCLNCFHPLSEIRLANRTTVYCKHCQH